MERRKWHYVYQTTNLINNRIYIGVHSTYKFKDSYIGSGTALKAAIKIYGRKNFSVDILCFYDTREEALEEEVFIVTKEWVKESSNYNLTIGGRGSNYNRHKSRSDVRWLPNRERYPNGKLRPPRKGRNNIKVNSNEVLNLDNGVIYPSIAELARILQIHVNTLRYRIYQKKEGYNYQIITSPKYLKLANT